MATAKAGADAPQVVIKPPSIGAAIFTIQGTTPFMTARFSKKAEIMEGMKNPTPGKKRARTGRDYDAEWKAAAYRSPEGWWGMNAAAFRNASISACRLVGFKMTIAKLSIFVEADGVDEVEGTPLVRITYGEPSMSTMPVRNANNSTDVRARPIWAPGWQMQPTIRWDMDQFKLEDITNLLWRVGMQVGVGEGRPDSRDSAGLGFGCFKINGVTQVLGMDS